MYVSGDGEGGIEMTESMQLIRDFCDRLVNPEKVARTRIVSTKFLERLLNYALFFFTLSNFDAPSFS